jgi:putative dehydrogenase
MSANSERGPVGVVGVGRVGDPIARWLLRQGHEVVVLRRGPTDALEEAGARRGDSFAAMLGECDVVILALPSADALATLVASLDVAPRAFAHGPVVIDLSTCDVSVKEAAAVDVARHGALLLDCPVSGMFDPLRDPPIDTMFASGPEEGIARVAWLLEKMVSTLHVVGAFGLGTTVKLVANTLVSVHTAVTAEAMALGVRAGLDPEVLVAVLSSSPATSWVLQDRALRMVRGPYDPPRASVDILLKDIGTILRLAEHLGVELPVLDAARGRFVLASERGHGAEDVSGVYRVALPAGGAARA